MTENTNFKVNMVEIINYSCPFIEVTYTNRDGEKRHGLMMIDSCSSVNHLMGKFANDVKTEPAKKQDSITILSIGDTEREAPCVSAEISFGGEQFTEDFVLQDDFGIVIQGDRPFIGLLGISFMLRHRLVADFSSHTVYRSFVNHSNFCISDTDYFFPMEIGLNFYGVPVVGLKTQGDDIVAAIDSGSHENIIAEAVLPKVSPDHHYTGEQTETVCYTCTVDSREVEAKFSLLGVNNNGDEKIYNKVTDHFLVVKSHIFSREQPKDSPQEDHLPPVNALIGSNFMNTNGWTLDFGAQLIYKRRVPLSA